MIADQRLVRLYLLGICYKFFVDSFDSQNLLYFAKTFRLETSYMQFKKYFSLNREF